MKNAVRRVALFALVAAATITLKPGTAADQKLDRALRDMLASPGRQSFRVFVRGRENDGEALSAVADQHARVIDEQAHLQTVTAQVSREQLRAIAADARVSTVSFDAPVHGMVFGSKTKDTVLLNTLGVPLNEYSEAKNVGVAIIDSGFAPAKADDFEKPVFYDFTTGETNPSASQPYDRYGHGTHVAGLIAGEGKGSEGRYFGVAPKAKLIHLKALDENGEGYTSWVVNALKFAVTNRVTLGIDVINMSLGHPVYEPAASDPLVQAVEQAVRAGIVVVVSAGNNGGDPETHEVGYAGVNSPGNARSAITVGALDMNGTASRLDDVIPWYSSRGPTWYDGLQKPDLVAPGHRMVSSIDRNGTLYAQYPQYIAYGRDKVEAKEANYFRLSGTSMSSAVVAGAAAMIISRGRDEFHASLPPNAVKAVLEFTALPLASYDTLTQGAGALNLKGALDLAERLDPTVARGSWWLTSGISPVTTIAGNEMTWGQRVVWGDQLLWGDQIYTSQAAWALRVVWGERVVWGDQMIWGDSTVWSIASRVVWGERVVWGDGMLGYSSGNGIIWGDASGFAVADSNVIIWGDVANSTLSSLSADEDPFGVEALDEDRPVTRHHVKKTKDQKGEGSVDRHKERSERKTAAGGDR